MIESEFGDPRVSIVPPAGAQVRDAAAVDSLKMLLDYAMAEGTELGLPVFVSLLRMASLELDKAATPAPARVRRSGVAQGREERVEP